jgi:hypothetical protein
MQREGFRSDCDECGLMRTMFIAYWIVITLGLAGSILVGLTGR